jgi:ubiquinone/menaquinone biosynthesis C-methylase UbiE
VNEYYKKNNRYRFISEKISKQPDITRIIDCACGDGSGSLELIMKGFSVTGFDISEDRVGEARLRNPNSHVGSICGLNCEDSSFDCFVCSETLEHLDPNDAQVACDEIKRICKANGIICVTVPANRKKSLKSKLHKQYISEDDIYSLFEGCEKLFSSIFFKNKNAEAGDKGNTVVILRNLK